MKKINVFYIILVVLAILMTLAVLYKDMKQASLKGEEAPVETVVRVDTVYVTKIVHDTVYVEKGGRSVQTPVEHFIADLRAILNDNIGPFYQEYENLTEENIQKAKVRFEECEKAAKKQYDALVASFIKDYPEELDYINNLVSKELTNAIKPYLHMLNEYGNRKK